MSATGYTRELARIKAIQKAWEYRHYGRPMKKPEPMSFKEWLLRGMEHYKKEYGFTFELVTPSLMRINRPGQNSLLRTYANFRDEYENEYLSKF
jgi:hypothetical protein